MTQDKRRGFTIIELMLAMGFIAVLLLSIAMTIIQIGKIYNRGMVIKDINQSSRAISEDLNRSFTEATAFDPSKKFVEVKTSGKLSGGRLCVGRYSYVWNTARALQEGDSGVVRYTTKPNDQVHFVKVTDPSGLYCEYNTDGQLRYKNIQSTEESGAQEFLSTGDYKVGISAISILSPASVYDSIAGGRLYNVSYTISAGSSSALNAAQTQCKAPGETGADVDYCNVQTFEIVVRTGGS